MQLELRLGAEQRVLGSAQDSPEKLENMRASLRRLADAVGEGMFSLRAEASWRFTMEFTTEQDWKSFEEKPTCGGIQADRRRIEKALARPDGAVVVTDDELAVVYERLETTSA